MPEPCGTQQVPGIPASSVDNVMRNFMFSSPISISKQQDADGTFTVTAVFPPCQDGAEDAAPVQPTAAMPAAQLSATPGSGGTGAAAPAAPAAGASDPVPNKGFDANRDCSKLVAKITTSGVNFVTRYYSHSASKNLSAAEAKVLSDAGINIVTVWEADGADPATFTRANGVNDATSAHTMAMSIGQPAGTPIYFAVDFDATPVQVNAGVIPYFQGVAAGFAAIAHGNPAYTAGVYGSGFVCDKLFGLGLVTHTWLSMSAGWLGSRTYAGWNMRQHLTSDPFNFGFSIDPDEAKAEYGGFRVA